MRTVSHPTNCTQYIYQLGTQCSRIRLSRSPTHDPRSRASYGPAHTTRSVFSVTVLAFPPLPASRSAVAADAAKVEAPAGAEAGPTTHDPRLPTDLSTEALVKVEAPTGAKVGRTCGPRLSRSPSPDPRLFSFPPLMADRYSYLSASTGFAMAARTACEPTVTNATAVASNPARTNTLHPSSMR